MSDPTAEQVIDRALKDHKGRYSPVNERTAAFIKDELLYFGLLSEGAPSETLEAAINAYVRHLETSSPFQLSVIENWNEHVEAMRAALTAARVSVDTPGIGAATDSRTQGVTPLNLEKVAEVLRREDWTDEMWDDMPQRDRDRNWELYLRAARALCVAYTEGKLT